MKLLSCLLFCQLSLLVLGFPVHNWSSPQTRLVFEFPAGTWIENIAVRGNGSLLLTSIDFPGGLWSLNPFDGTDAVLVADFPYNSTLGIVETTSDNFYVLTSNFNLLGGPTVEIGSNGIFNVNFNSRNDRGAPQVSEVLIIPEAMVFNGLTKFNDTVLLISDSKLGVIFGVDITTADYWIAANDTLMQPTTPPGTFQEGINGVHFRPAESTVYFTNSQQRIFAKVELDPVTVTAARPAQWTANSITQDGVEVTWDDFALDTVGNAYIATEPGNGVQRVSADGHVIVFAGNVNSTKIAEPTAAAFGRTNMDNDVLYVTTAGGLAYPVWENGVAMKTGAQVVAVKVCYD